METIVLSITAALALVGFGAAMCALYIASGTSEEWSRTQLQVDYVEAALLQYMKSANLSFDLNDEAMREIDAKLAGAERICQARVHAALEYTDNRPYEEESGLADGDAVDDRQLPLL
jgi:hypothetical protein